MLLGTELHAEGNLAEGHRGLSRHHAPEWRMVGLEVLYFEVELVKRLEKKDIEGTSSVDQHLLEADVPDNRVKDKGKTTRGLPSCPDVRSAERDGVLGPLLDHGVDHHLLVVLAISDYRSPEDLLVPLGLGRDLATKDDMDVFVRYFEFPITVMIVIVVVFFLLDFLVGGPVVSTVALATARTPVGGFAEYVGETPIVNELVTLMGCLGQSLFRISAYSLL